MKVLVLGAGELGEAVLQSLARHPKKPESSQVSVLLRPATIQSTDPEKQKLRKSLQDLNVSVVAGDILKTTSRADRSNPETDDHAEDDEELVSIFRGYDVVIGCSGSGFPPGTQEKLAQLVLRANVKLYIPWQFGVDYDVIGQGSSQPLFDEQLRVRALLRSQTDTEWLIVSTGAFMSLVFLAAFGMVDREQRTVRALGGWGDEFTTTTAEDIGRMTAEVVWDRRGLRNQVVHIGGDTLTFNQLADLVEKKWGEGAGQDKWKMELWDQEVITKQLAAGPESMMPKYRMIWAVGRGVSWPMEQTENAKRSVSMTGVSEYMDRL